MKSLLTAGIVFLAGVALLKDHPRCSERYQRTEARQDTRAGSYARKLDEPY